MQCEHTVSSMMDYLDGELPGNAARAIECHLAGCSSCAARYHFERALKKRLQAAARVPPPPRLRRRLAEMLRQDTAWSHGPG